MEQLSDILERLSKPLTISAGFVLVVLIALIYTLTGVPVLLVFFVIPVLLVTLSAGSAAGGALSIVSAMAVLLADLPDYQGLASLWTTLLNSFISLLLFLGVVYVIREYKEVLQRERAYSHEDPLTGLPNLRGFFELAEREIVRAKRKKTPISIAYLGLDNLNQVIEQRGKKTADAILHQLAQSLVNNTRRTDVSARISATDFILLMSEAGIEGGMKGIRRVNDLLMQIIQEYELPVSFSIGLVTYNILPENIEQMIDAANAVKNEPRDTGPDSIPHQVVDL